MQDPTTPAATTVTPCWYTVQDATDCSTTPSQLTFKTDPAQMTLPMGTSTVISCAVTPQGSGSN